MDSAGTPSTASIGRSRYSAPRICRLSYLTLERSAGTLSGGESQRIRLATQIGSRLTGVMYILDEPSIGLHQRDNRKLLDTLIGMRDLGNTVIIVEHDEETIRSADYVVDLGPGAGELGGEVVVAGTPKQVCRHKRSRTGALSAPPRMSPSGRRRSTRRFSRSEEGREMALEREFYTANQLADLLAVSRKTVDRIVRRGTGIQLTVRRDEE